MVVNGKEFSLDQLHDRNLEALIYHFGLNPAAVAVERNGQIAARESYRTIELQDSDTIELIRFVGGGA